MAQLTLPSTAVLYVLLRGRASLSTCSLCVYVRFIDFFFFSENGLNTVLYKKPIIYTLQYAAVLGLDYPRKYHLLGIGTGNVQGKLRMN